MLKFSWNDSTHNFWRPLAVSALNRRIRKKTRGTPPEQKEKFKGAAKVCFRNLKNNNATKRPTHQNLDIIIFELHQEVTAGKVFQHFVKKNNYIWTKSPWGLLGSKMWPFLQCDTLSFRLKWWDLTGPSSVGAIPSRHMSADSRNPKPLRKIAFWQIMGVKLTQKALHLSNTTKKTRV